MTAWMDDLAAKAALAVDHDPMNFHPTPADDAFYEMKEACTPARVAALLAVATLADEFVKRLEICQPAIDNAFLMEHIHGRPYSGPQYGEQLKALKASLVALLETEHAST